MLYGASPREPGQDVLQTLGEKFGYERLFYLQQDRLKGKDSETIAKDEQEEGYTQFSPGTQVVKINHSKKTKLDPNFKSKIYTVLAALNNNVYILANPKGIRMKRAICCRTVTDRS